MKRRSLHNVFIRFIEKVFERSKLLTSIYIAFFTKMTLDEFSRVSIPEDGKVLVIGCGSIPHTVIILAREKQWRITGIDRDSEAIEKARALVERYGLKEKVTITEGDGLTFGLSGYDLIVVAHGVEPKGKVLERVVEDMDAKAVVLFRTTWDALDVVYGEEDVPEGVSVVDVFYRFDLIKSIVMTVDANRKTL